MRLELSQSLVKITRINKAGSETLMPEGVRGFSSKRNSAKWETIPARLKLLRGRKERGFTQSKVYVKMLSD